MMEQYILSCINEDKELVSTQAFATLAEAQEQMIREHDSHLYEFEQNDDYIEDHSLGQHYAHIYYADNLEYHWEITNIDVPSALFATIVRNIFFIFRDDLEHSDDTRRLALFKAIFGEQMGAHIYHSHWRSDCLYDFIASLDGENIKKFADYLLDYHKYRSLSSDFLSGCR